MNMKVMIRILVVVFVCLLVVAILVEGGGGRRREGVNILEKTCYVENDGTYTIVDGIDWNNPKTGAVGRFQASINVTGWDVLHIESSSEQMDDDQMYCAGLIEGSISQEQIFIWYTNYFKNHFGGKGPSSPLLSFMDDQRKWVLSHCNTTATASDIVSNEEDEDDDEVAFWNHTCLLMKQFHGMLDGYNRAAPKDQQLLEQDLYMLTSTGDLEDLEEIYPNNEKTVVTSMKKDLKDFPMLDCSGYVKLLPDRSDLLVGHDTWTSYFGMNRVFKHFELPLKSPKTAASGISFSSKPAFLASKDDFYMMNSGLVSIETTNAVFNETLHKQITPESLFSWQRVVVANRMSSDGNEWVDFFSRYNSGTYNNQWMVVNMKLFTPNLPLVAGTLFVLEQIPTYIHSDDQTGLLSEQGYWPSYNIPFYEDVYNMSGYPEKAKKYGDAYSYENCPRAKIYKRNDTQVGSLQDMLSLMRYNNWEVDPLSLDDPGNSIASRYDLRSSIQGNPPPAFGAIDSKVTSFSLLFGTFSFKRADSGNMTCWAQAGPTHDQQPVFKWTDAYKDVSHIGQPEKFDFKWTEMNSFFDKTGKRK